MLSNLLIDNSSDDLRMDHILRRCLTAESEDLRTVYIATGYWDLEALRLVRDELYAFLDKEGSRLCLLIGKDPYVYSEMMKSPTYQGKKYPQEFIRTDLDSLELRKEYLDMVSHLIRYCEEGRMEVRLYLTDAGGEAQMMHSKCFIFDGEETGFGIIGSSNFTAKGLRGNAELNYLETNPSLVSAREPVKGHKSHLSWFLEHWDLASDWTPVFLEQVLRSSRPGKALAASKPNLPSIPYELYIWYLIRKLSDIADPRALTLLRSYLPEEMSPLSFQFDAVLQCSHIMKQHGGFFLADVVGLGKTVTAMMIIKKFLAENSDPHRPSRVLILTPPAVRKSWEDTLNLFDREAKTKVKSAVRILSTGMVAQLFAETEDPEESVLSGIASEEEIVPTEDYGMIVIDESHNFRNNRTKKYKALQSLISGIEQRNSLTPYIGLLSATPQNNSPEDLRNQIFLFERNPGRSTLTSVDKGDLLTFFSELVTEYNKLRKLPPEQSEDQLRQLSEELREKVLSELVVRRTRHDIEKYYPADAELLSFPQVEGPAELHYRFDTELSRLFERTVRAILPDEQDEGSVPHLGFYRYSAIKFLVDPTDQALYSGKNLSVDEISARMGTLTQINLVKRLESSFAAFKTSLNNLRVYTQNMIDMLNADTVFIGPDLDVNQIIIREGSLDKAIPVLQARIKAKGGSNRQYRAADFHPTYRDKLLEDLSLLDDLRDKWDKVDTDPKMDDFIKLLPQLLDRKINNPRGKDEAKLVIFAEALDTVDSLAKRLTEKGCPTLVVSAANSRDMEEEIRANFDANYSGEWRNDYTAIVTTMVLAEGVNLHRANVILNYDTPWNSTRLMQQIGRVNRIGSPEKTIHVFNYFPTSESDKVLSLVRIAYTKIQSFLTTFGEDSRIYMQTEKLDPVSFARRSEQEEESPMAPYIADLKAYQQAYPITYAQLSDTTLNHFTRLTEGAESADLVLLEPGQVGIGTASGVDGLRVISPLEMMKALRCDPVDRFIDIEESEQADIAKMEKEALIVGNTFKDPMANNKEMPKKVKQARDILHDQFRKEVSRDSEAKKVYGAVKDALDYNNGHVAELLLRLAEEPAGLLAPAVMLTQTFTYLLKMEAAASTTDLSLSFHLLRRHL